MALGDSLTAGYGLPRDAAYPAQLEMLLIKEGYDVAIVNAGVSGETSTQTLGRLDWVLKRGGPYAIVLLGIGANDGLRAQPVKMIEANLEKLVDRLKSPTTKVLLLPMKLPTNLDAKYRAQFEALYPRVAKKKNIPLAAFLLENVAGDPELNLGDGIHPNAKGAKKVAENLIPSLKPLLK